MREFTVALNLKHDSLVPLLGNSLTEALLQTVLGVGLLNRHTEDIKENSTTGKVPIRYS